MCGPEQSSQAGGNKAGSLVYEDAFCMFVRSNMLTLRSRWVALPGATEVIAPEMAINHGKYF